MPTPFARTTNMDFRRLQCSTTAAIGLDWKQPMTCLYRLTATHIRAQFPVFTFEMLSSMWFELAKFRKDWLIVA